MDVWLDLEDTIITHWDEGLLNYPNRIKNWLDLHNVTEIRIWSFAIWDQADKDHFVSSGMKQMIETALQRPILDFPSVEEMQQLIQQKEGIIYEDRTEFMQLHSKKWSFMKYCLGWHKDKQCVLIDDAVPNQTIIDHDLNLTIKLIRVYDI